MARETVHKRAPPDAGARQRARADGDGRDPVPGQLLTATGAAIDLQERAHPALDRTLSRRAPLAARVRARGLVLTCRSLLVFL